MRRWFWLLACAMSLSVMAVCLALHLAWIVPPLGHHYAFGIGSSVGLFFSLTPSYLAISWLHPLLGKPLLVRGIWTRGGGFGLTYDFLAVFFGCCALWSALRWHVSRNRALRGPGFAVGDGMTEEPNGPSNKVGPPGTNVPD